MELNGDTSVFIYVYEYVEAHACVIFGLYGKCVVNESTLTDANHSFE